MRSRILVCSCTPLLVCALFVVGCGTCGGTNGAEQTDAAAQTQSTASQSADESESVSSGEDSTPRMVKSDDLPETPRRIVALAPNVTEILFALNLGERIVAVSQHSDYPAQAKDKPSVGNYQNPDFESLIAHDPDLVVGTTSGGDKSIATRLEDADVAYFFVRMSNIEETLDGIRLIGGVVGRKSEAARLATNMEERMAKVAEKAEGRRSPRVMMVYGREPIVAAGPTTFGHQLIERAGGNNVFGEAGSNYPRVDVEKVLQVDPEIILDAAGMGRDAGATEFWSQFDSITAVKQGRVKYITETAIMRPGPRLPDGLELIAEAIRE